MDQLVQCPVCTLFLHNGMTLESHLDTHPKDQVIKALCSITANNGSYGSRTSTPMHSERSYRSRSRTPATEDSGVRWNGSHRGTDHDRCWRRTPSRTPKSNVSRNGTPSLEPRSGDMSFESNSVNGSAQYSSTPYAMKSDKMQQTCVQNVPLSDFQHQYVYYPDQQEDREIKYSRSAEYTATDNSNNVFAYNIPTMAPNVKLQTALLPTVPKRSNGQELVKMLPPKQNNIFFKTNMGGVQYIAQGVKPVHVVVPTSPAFVQKNVQNNMIMSGNIPSAQMLESKTMAPQSSTNQFNQISSGGFTPGTTVVTQNSQIIYREMVHNLDGKPFISSVPGVLGAHENVTNVAQASSMYQNVMVVDQFGNTSCMYTTPQQILPKACNTSLYNNNVPATHDKPITNIVNDPNRTLIIEYTPLVPSVSVGPITPTTTAITSQSESSPPKVTKPEKPQLARPSFDKTEERIETPSTSKGLKILSNIKVEVPVQHHKNLLNTTVDLTGPNESDYLDCDTSPEKILPDLHDNNRSMSDDCTQPSTSSGDSLVSHTFSVIKNVGNPPSYKESSTKLSVVDNKLETEFSDSCPIPDLICNEKPSISPCSELSEIGDNSTDRMSISPKPHTSGHCPSSIHTESKTTAPIQKPYRNNTLRLNNIYVKKHKKILQIKNAKSLAASSSSSSASGKTETETGVSSPTGVTPENFSMNKMHQGDARENKDITTLQAVSVDRMNVSDNHCEFDADTEEQSMDLEPTACTSQFTVGVDVVKVKEEVNNSNEGGFGNEAGTSSVRNLTPLESIRPINVISYGNMATGDFDDESNHKELLDLESASKSKQFVSMINENYFGDNMYADYFTAERVESFDADRESSSFPKDGTRDGMYIWGEPSQKESEFVLPNFIHESYKIAESHGVDYSEMGGGEGQGDACERDSKADVLSESHSEGEPPLNICADERMPPRGELSGQESNGDMESPWSGMYTEVTPAEPYDLIARESWVSDGSEVDIHEKRDNLEEELCISKARLYTCSQCGVKFSSYKELRGHKSTAHAMPTSSGSKTTYSRLVTARAIKKEDKTDVNTLPGNLLPLQDSKESIATTMLQVYDAMSEAKPKIERLIKQETKRRRRDYVCPTCKEDQGSDAAFNDHLKIHPLECLTCGKCFFRRANLALHLKMHLGIKNYKCDVCEKRFITRQKLKEHHNVHTGRAPVKCTVCDDTFRRYSNMVQHRNRHHFQKKAKVRDFVCHCGGVFHSRAKLRWHQETHEERPKACLYCSDKFVHAASLTRHVRRAHNRYYTPERTERTERGERARRTQLNVPCPICKQVYLKTNLRAHMQIHSGKRPYVCIICNKAFTTKWNLKLHRWIHTSRSAKPFKCNLCKGAFVRQTEYVSHMNAHKSVRPYTCNYCGRQFIRKYNCQRHVREHETAKKYVCKVSECGKSFHRSYYLSEHMKVHSGARPFACNICGKTSSNKSNHNKHVKIHHAREPVATEA